MTPALKTSGILAVATTLSVAALLLTHSSAPSAAVSKPSAPPGSLVLQADLASSHVLRGHHTTYMAVTLTAPEQPTQIRPMVDLAVVFDRSGSMEGEKLIQAKLAARQLIANLDNSDRFSITVYGSDVELLHPTTLATEAAKQAALTNISNIYTDGGTNLSGGLETGRAQLMSLDGAGGRVQRIVLISDGQANEGIVRPAELEALAARTTADGLSITTVGVGLDFDEKTMTQIAVSGRGNYYYAESADMLAGLFDTELKRLGATVATQVKLSLYPQSGVQVGEVVGYSRHFNKGWSSIDIPDMHAGETRKVIIGLSVTTPALSSIDLIDLSATFTNAATGVPQVQNLLVRAEIADSLTVINNNLDREANRLIERALTAKAIGDATTLYEQGRRGEADELLDGRYQAAKAQAAITSDSAFAAEMKKTSSKAKRAFSKPASSISGKKGRKSNRHDAYELMY